MKISSVKIDKSYIIIIYSIDGFLLNSNNSLFYKILFLFILTKKIYKLYY